MIRLMGFVASSALLLVAITVAPANARTVAIPESEYSAMQFETREGCLDYFVLATAPKFCRDGATFFAMNIQDVSLATRTVHDPPMMFFNKGMLWPASEYYWTTIEDIVNGYPKFGNPKLLIVLPNQNTLPKKLGTWRAAWMLVDRAQWKCSIYLKKLCYWSEAKSLTYATVQWKWDGEKMRNARAYGREVS